MFVFRKILRALFSCNTHFEIRPFALLATKLSLDERRSSILGGVKGDFNVYNLTESF